MHRGRTGRPKTGAGGARCAPGVVVAKVMVGACLVWEGFASMNGTLEMRTQKEQSVTVNREQDELGGWPG